MALKTKTPQRPDGSSLAASEIRITDKVERAGLDQTAAASRRTGRRPWDWYEKIGEVHYAITRSARVAGYAKLIPVRYAPDGVTIEEEIESGEAADIVAGIQSPFGGTRGLLDRFYTLMKVPGDSYLIRVKEGADYDGYHLLSPDELNTHDGFFDRFKPGRNPVTWTMIPAVSGPDGNQRFTREILPQDFLGRIWQPSRRYVQMTDSALSALDTECEALHLLTESIKGQLMSRFAMAGILFLPPGVSTARTSRDQETVASQKIDNTMNLLIATMTRNMKSWDDAKAMMPILLRGTNPDDGEKIKHIIMDRSVAETDLKLRSELISRILVGLDSNQDTTMGIGEQSHWGAWAACVTPDTEIFTAQGWKIHDQLQIDDEILSLNHDTGLTEWDAVRKINVFDVENEEMLSLETRTHSSLSTLNHRWPVLQRTTEKMVDGFYRRWRLSEDINTGSQIQVAAPHASLPAEQKWSDDLVELVAWTWTEGSMAYRHGREQPRVAIYQSHEANPELVDRIRATLTRLYGQAHRGQMPATRRSAVKDPTPRWREIVRDNGMTVFKLNSVIAGHLDAICPRRIVDLEWVRELTASQLELFIRVSILADGHGNEITQKDPLALNALELAAVLSGRAVTRSEIPATGYKSGTKHVLRLKSNSVVDFQKGGVERRRYTGQVWCPTTGNGTWLARRNGQMFFTGNSDEERRIAVQPDLEMGAWAFTRLILHKQLMDGPSSMSADQIARTGVWFDLSPAAVKSNPQEDARQAYDRILISDSATRRMSGISNTDAPSEQERVRAVGRAVKNPMLMLYGTNEYDTIDWDTVMKMPASTGPAPDSPADDPESGPGEGDPGSPDDQDRSTPRTQRPA